MSTKPKRKYGGIRKGVETSAGTNEAVFDKFLGTAATAGRATTPSTPPSTRTSTPARAPSTPPAPQNVSPRRDYQKVANSITREAVPAGMFNGKAKQLYDCLYSLTRGAIVPSMTVRISRAELMKKSGIGAKVTLEQNLRRLIASGLVAMKTIGGIQGGNEYTVYLPEETIPSTPPSTGTSPPSPPSGGEKVGLLAPLETSLPSNGVSVDSKAGSGDPKTSFKTNTEKIIDDDDAALAAMNRALKEAAKEITGRELTFAESERWKELADVLIAELKIAAARTTVSSVPSFLAEHLRRRLWKVDKRQARAEGRELPDEAVNMPSEAAKGCPDCSGSGWWYPEGIERGVAKCKHTSLNQGAGKV